MKKLQERKIKFNKDLETARKKIIASELHIKNIDKFINSKELYSIEWFDWYLYKIDTDELININTWNIMRWSTNTKWEKQYDLNSNYWYSLIVKQKLVKRKLKKILQTEKN